MNGFKTALLVAALSFAGSGCDFRDDNKRGSGPPPPTAQSYTATVTAIQIVNKDSGEALVVEGFPAQGGVLTIE